MKKVLLLVVLMSTHVLNAQVQLPADFELAPATYALTDFGGTASLIVVDPTDPTNKVVRTVKSTQAATWAGTTLAEGVGFTSALPFNSNATTMSVRVWSPDAGIQVRLKVENKNDVTVSVETNVNTTVAGGWETLVFDFKTESTGTAAINYASTYDKASIFFNFGVEGSAAGEKTYYWDDVTFLGMPTDGEPSDGIQLPITFEDTTFDWNAAFTNFDGGTTTIIDNPDPSSFNNSARVGRMVKNTGAVWAGSYINLGSNLDLATYPEMSVTVWAPKPNSKLLLKIENSANPALNYERNLTIPIDGMWTELTFDMSGANMANTYDRIVLIFDLGIAGNGGPNFTWFFDNIRYTAVTTNIEQVNGELPTAVRLNQNYPNPFNPTTQIQFSLPSAENVRLDVFNTVGQLVATVANGSYSAGEHTVNFDASALSSGLYIYRLQTGSVTLTKKMTLMK